MYKNPRNQHVAPEHDKWHAKHEAWVQLKRMSKLAGTGYYIPPAWYQHFRMFPPVHHNFNQAETENPHNAAEQTQVAGDKLHEDHAQRAALRTELARHSRSAASAGNRYLNQFWVRKPIDDMEREYYSLTKTHGVAHDEAIRRVIRQYHKKQAVRARVHTIQAEEARQTGKFITMREALSVMNLLQGIQSATLATHQYAEIADEARTRYSEDPMVEAAVTQRRVARAKPEPVAAADETSGAAAAADGESSDASSSEGATKAAAPAVDVIEDDFELIEEVSMASTSGDSLPKLREQMHDGSLTAEDVEEGSFWYDGFTPEVSKGDGAGGAAAAGSS